MASFPQDLPAGASLALPGDALPRQGWFKKNFRTKRFLFISVFAHLFLGLVASVYIVQTFSAKKSTFTAASAASAPAAANREHKVQMQKKQQTMSAPAQMKRVTSTAANTKVALPQLPILPTLANTLTPVRIAGMGGTGTGLALGGGGGAGGGGGGRPVSLFGVRTAGTGTLTGTFYDFKQTANGQPTNMAAGDDEGKANAANSKFIGQFALANFNPGMVANYFKGPQPLYASQLFIPVIRADDGPKEFDLADKVQPRRWAIVYRGRVTPPEAGRYHFVGVTDDYLIVRFRGRIVLDGSLRPPTGKKPVQTYSYAALRENVHLNEGDPFDVEAGEHCDIEILIGELPGGYFYTFLMLEKDGVSYASDPKGGPILPVFKVGPGETNHSGKAIATLPDQSWSIWKADTKP